MPDKTTGDTFYPSDLIAYFKEAAFKSFGDYKKTLALMRQKYPQYNFEMKQIYNLCHHLIERGTGKRDKEEPIAKEPVRNKSAKQTPRIYNTHPAKSEEHLGNCKGCIRENDPLETAACNDCIGGHLYMAKSAEPKEAGEVAASEKSPSTIGKAPKAEPVRLEERRHPQVGLNAELKSDGKGNYVLLECEICGNSCAGTFATLVKDRHGKEFYAECCYMCHLKYKENSPLSEKEKSYYGSEEVLAV